MFSTLKQKITADWSPLRLFVLIFGLILLYNWFVHSATVSGFLALIFLYQGLNNKGCMVGKCTLPNEKKVH